MTGRKRKSNRLTGNICDVNESKSAAESDDVRLKWMGLQDVDRLAAEIQKPGQVHLASIFELFSPSLARSAK
jgi:hypothetical protein